MSKYKSLNQSENMIGKASLYLSAVNSLDGSMLEFQKNQNSIQ